MKRCVLTIFLFGLAYSRLVGQSSFSMEVDSLILRGIDQTFICHFDSALGTFQKVIDRYPDHIVGYFYQAATLQSKMMDYETDRWEKEFYRLVDEARRTGIKQIEEGDENPWTYFYLGSAFSYKGLYQAKSGGLVSGFLSARKGLGYLRKALERDSTLYDAYLGLGSYQYWSGRFSKYLDWLPGIRDERDEGIRMVKLSVENGTFSYWVGINSLAWIEYDRKHYRIALSLFKKGVEKYPGSRFFLWGVADTYFRLGYHVQAAKVYNDLLVSIQNDSINNGYNEVVCRFKLVRTHLALKQYEEALHHCDAILERKVSPNIERRIERRLEYTKEYRKKCIKALRANG